MVGERLLYSTLITSESDSVIFMATSVNSRLVILAALNDRY